MSYQTFGSKGRRVRKTFCSCHPFTVGKHEWWTWCWEVSVCHRQFAYLFDLSRVLYSPASRERRGPATLCHLRGHRGAVCLFTIKESICQHDLIKYPLHVSPTFCVCVCGRGEKVPILRVFNWEISARATGSLSWNRVPLAATTACRVLQQLCSIRGKKGVLVSFM